MAKQKKAKSEEQKKGSKRRSKNKNHDRSLSSMSAQDRELAKAIRRTAKPVKEKYRVDSNKKGAEYMIGVGRFTSELPKEWR